MSKATRLNTKKPMFDESLYSRQIYALGINAMSSITRTSVFISCGDNLSGLGIELAKCIILAGLKRVTIHSQTDTLTYLDLASNYYVDESLIGLPFRETVRQNLASLNNNVTVDSSDYLTDKILGDYDIAVFVDYNVHNLLYWNTFCRTHGIKFISLQTYGMAGNLFCDFGDQYLVNDIDGEPHRTGIVSKIENGKFFTAEPHHIYTGDVVTFSGRIAGIDTKTIDQKPIKYLVKTVGSEFELHPFQEIHNALTPDELRIAAFRSKRREVPDQIPQNLVFYQIKLPVVIKFKSLGQSLDDPDYVMFDTVDQDMPKILHVFMKTLSCWRIRNKYMQGNLYDIRNTFPVPIVSGASGPVTSVSGAKGSITSVSGAKGSVTGVSRASGPVPVVSRASGPVPVVSRASGPVPVVSRASGSGDYGYVRALFELELTGSGKDVKFSAGVKKIFDQLFHTCRGRVCGVDAMIGSLGAQEVIKAASGKFMPNKQFLHFETLNILPDNYLETIQNKTIDVNHTGSRYDGQIVIFGKDYVDQMHNKKVFVVGAGAIGCEHIKNFSMMGINNIVITDMDHIENSNLNRQFLFRRQDIGKPKSTTVAEKAVFMNPDLKITAHQNKVGKETANIYGSLFFDTIDVVANALDNIEARLYVDGLCVKYNKPLLEAGTLGTKGNVQSIVPHLTESYSSLQDPVEQNIPVCTLKLFPYKFEHVVQYARDRFEGYFNTVPSNLIKAIKMPGCLNTMTPQDLATIYDDIKLITMNCRNFKYCINLGYREWHRLFRDQINQLIRKYPKNHRDDEQNMFWSGNKMFPESFEFDPMNETDLDFVISFSQIWADMLGMPINKRYPAHTRDPYIKFLQRLQKKKIRETICQDIGFDQNKNNGMVDSKIRKKIKNFDQEQYIEMINEMIEPIKEYLLNVRVIEFDQDNDSNHHIDFITAGSNKRAMNYRIDTADRLTVKGIAGKIIPALATTTSLVSGLIALEMYKLFYGQLDKRYNNLQRYRYGSFNLAVQTFGFSESNPPKLTNINGTYRSVWSHDTLDSGITIRDIIERYSESSHIKKGPDGQMINVPLEFEFIAGDNGIIFSNMMDGPCNGMDDGDQDQDGMDKKLIDIIRETMDKDQDQGTGDYFFTVSLEKITNDDEQDLDLGKINTDTMITCKIRV
jgi:ubiquitin-activating enzyme E1